MHMLASLRSCIDDEFDVMAPSEFGSCQMLHVMHSSWLHICAVALYRTAVHPCLLVCCSSFCWAYLQLICSDLALVGQTGFKLALDKR